MPLTDENIFIAATCKEKGITYLKGNAKTMVRKNVENKEPAPSAPTQKGNAKSNILAEIAGTISAVYKKPGDAVFYGEPVFAYKTANCELQIPALDNGRIKSIDVAQGTAIVPGSLLATIE